jgi:hypothetical protein
MDRARAARPRGFDSLAIIWAGPPGDKSEKATKQEFAVILMASNGTFSQLF